jgi:POT family proton-dependent oligopeptide transporter
LKKRTKKLLLSGARPIKQTELWGHPVGLAYLLATEAFERFSYYGMQALLVLYMAGHLLQPGTADHVFGLPTFRNIIESVTGKLTVQALATQIFGLYTGLVYLTPIAGGIVGDRWLGRRRAILIGLALMAAGHFLMAIESMFLVALATLATGGALLKGSVPAQISGLYVPHDSRRDRAFSMFYMAINGGGMLAPLLCGTLGELCGWAWGFGAAGIIMLGGLAAYIAGIRHTPPDPTAAQRAARPANAIPAAARLAAFAIVWLVAALFWTVVSQGWNTYTLWVRDHVDRHILGHTVPVTWFASLDAGVAVGLAPLVLLIWARQAKRRTEPHDLAKIALGCAGYAFYLLLLGASHSALGWKLVPLAIVIPLTMLSAFAYLYVAPVLAALVARAVPANLTGTAVAVYYTTIFAGSTASGSLGALYGAISDLAFWCVHAAIVGVAAAIVVALRPFLSRALDD